MSNNNILERVFRLWAKVAMMIVDGTRDAEKVADILQTIVDETKTYLSELFVGVDVVATDGTETFESSGIFTGGIYGLAVPKIAKGKPTKATKATVWELILDASFALFFGSLSKNRKRWTEHQIVQFCRDNSDKLKISLFTFLEMEGGVVAGVYFYNEGELVVEVLSFFEKRVWLAEYRRRVVSLQ